MPPEWAASKRIYKVKDNIEDYLYGAEPVHVISAWMMNKFCAPAQTQMRLLQLDGSNLMTKDAIEKAPYGSSARQTSLLVGEIDQLNKADK